MGLDIQYQAMPEDCSLLERARHEPEFGCHLEFFKENVLAPHSRLNRYANDQIFAEFIAEARSVVHHHPRIEMRNLDGGRRWDMLHYLLSENRRKSGANNELDWAKKAIRGGQILNPQTQTTIGSPIRYLLSYEARQISDYLDAITTESLHRHWNVAAMIQAAVYKIHPDDNDETFEWVRASFQELKNFYVLVNNHGEGALTCIE